MLTFAQTLKWVSYSSTPTDYNTKLLETVCWFYIYLVCFVWHNKLVCKTLNDEKVSKLLCPIFWDFTHNFGKSKFFVGTLRLHPHLLHHCVQVSLNNGKSLQFSKMSGQYSQYFHKVNRKTRWLVEYTLSELTGTYNKCFADAKLIVMRSVTSINQHAISLIPS